MNLFTEEYPSLESYFRSVILFGKNSASYKFALAKTLIELSKDHNSNTFIPLEDLAAPFSKYICEHLKINDKQATSKSSQFLNACRDFNNGKLSHDDLILLTKRYGFVNVLDAFHIVSQESIPTKFFEVNDNGRNKGIILSDNLYNLNLSVQFNNFYHEVEARWRLVETAWSLQISPALLNVHFDEESKIFFINEDDKNKRINVTSSRDSLNGYQKGKCFYCFDNISIHESDENLADVDHFFPHTLQRQTRINLNGVWNLVLACKSCNRGQSGKFDKIPELKYLNRLHKRNEFFIESHHPLRETLINQTGKTLKHRTAFLQNMYKESRNQIVVSTWKPIYEFEPAF
jgi:hypothetical protein